MTIKNIVFMDCQIYIF